MDQVIEDTEHTPLYEVNVKCEEFYVIDEKPVILSLVGVLCCCISICYCNKTKKACFAEHKVVKPQNEPLVGKKKEPENKPQQHDIESTKKDQQPAGQEKPAQHSPGDETGNTL